MRFVRFSIQSRNDARFFCARLLELFSLVLTWPAAAGNFYSGTSPANVPWPGGIVPYQFTNMLTAAEKTGKLRSAKRGIYPFFAYAIAHEAHHRGQIIAHLKHARTPVDRTLGFALWEWEKL